MQNQNADKRRFELLGEVLEFFKTEYSEGVIKLIMTSLEPYTTSSLEKAAPILMRNFKSFSVKDWTDIIHEGGFYEPIVHTVEDTMTDEEWSVLMNQEDEFYNRLYPHEEN